jgi:hypothetical protein
MLAMKNAKLKMKSEIVKLPAHPVRTGQARRGRSTELSALSMSKGFPARITLFHIVPLDPAYPARAGRGTIRSISKLRQEFFPHRFSKLDKTVVPI